MRKSLLTAFLVSLLAVAAYAQESETTAEDIAPAEVSATGEEGATAEESATTDDSDTDEDSATAEESVDEELVAETDEEGVDGSFRLVLRLTTRWQEERLLHGVLQRVVDAVFGGLGDPRRGAPDSGRRAGGP